jgi:hypothetical protein
MLEVRCLRVSFTLSIVPPIWQSCKVFLLAVVIAFSIVKTNRLFLRHNSRPQLYLTKALYRVFSTLLLLICVTALTSEKYLPSPWETQITYYIQDTITQVANPIHKKPQRQSQNLNVHTKPKHQLLEPLLHDIQANWPKTDRQKQIVLPEKGSPPASVRTRSSLKDKLALSTSLSFNRNFESGKLTKPRARGAIENIALS